MRVIKGREDEGRKGGPIDKKEKQETDMKRCNIYDFFFKPKARLIECRLVFVGGEK